MSCKFNQKTVRHLGRSSGLKGPVTKVLYKGVWVQIPTGIIRIWYDKAITIYDGIPFLDPLPFCKGPTVLPVVNL